jgi:hypothetical protein
MHEIEVSTVSPEAASDGIAELWAGGQSQHCWNGDDAEVSEASAKGDNSTYGGAG